MKKCKNVKNVPVGDHDFLKVENLRAKIRDLKILQLSTPSLKLCSIPREKHLTAKTREIRQRLKIPAKFSGELRGIFLVGFVALTKRSTVVVSESREVTGKWPESSEMVVVAPGIAATDRTGF
ncbi:unnamed protein product [Lactuca saligna]|uniref:Uncharacterized protein n=1 Tax=Lactuca saligna TaxID=75948 RepID=A0AA35ZA69_LACSI|nr:unnamed protein product [Lactuca saligna]